MAGRSPPVVLFQELQEAAVGERHSRHWTSRARPFRSEPASFIQYILKALPIHRHGRLFIESTS